MSEHLDEFIDRFSEPSRKWLKEHKDWIADPEKSGKLQKAHFHAIGEGLVPDSDEYFKHVEKRVGLRDSDGDNNVVIRRAPREEPKVTLSQRGATAATDGTHTWNYDDPKGKFKKGEPIGVQEFAKRKQIMTKQGYYSKLD
jgi:hypothetical protein